jgi:hypothetical protein
MSKLVDIAELYGAIDAVTANEADDTHETGVVIEARPTSIDEQLEAAKTFAPTLTASITHMATSLNALVDQVSAARERREPDEAVWIALSDKLRALMAFMKEEIVEGIKKNKCEVLAFIVSITTDDGERMFLGDWIRECGYELLCMTNLVAECGSKCARAATRGTPEPEPESDAESGADADADADASVGAETAPEAAQEVIQGLVQEIVQNATQVVTPEPV